MSDCSLGQTIFIIGGIALWDASGTGLGGLIAGLLLLGFVVFWAGLLLSILFGSGDGDLGAYPPPFIRRRW
jgi:hypothetical protein